MLRAPRGDPAGGGHDLPGDEALRAERRLVVEEDPAAGEQPVGLAVVGDLPERGRLRHRVGAARAEGRLLVRPLARRVAEALAGAGVVEADRPLREPDGLEQVERPDPDALHRLDRLVEREPDRALAREVVDLVGLDLHQRREHAPEVARRDGQSPHPLADPEPGQAGEARARSRRGRCRKPRTPCGAGGRRDRRRPVRRPPGSVPASLLACFGPFVSASRCGSRGAGRSSPPRHPASPSPAPGTRRRSARAGPGSSPASSSWTPPR